MNLYLKKNKKTIIENIQKTAFTKHKFTTANFTWKKLQNVTFVNENS